MKNVFARLKKIFYRVGKTDRRAGQVSQWHYLHLGIWEHMKISNWTDKFHAFRTGTIDIPIEVLSYAEHNCHDRAQSHKQPPHRSPGGFHSSLKDADAHAITQNGAHSVSSLRKRAFRTNCEQYIAHASAEELEYTDANSSYGHLACQKWYPLLAAEAIVKRLKFYPPSSISRLAHSIHPTRFTEN
jgi:hypothetical protein